VIVINMKTGTYYSIRDIGAVAWRDLAAGHAVETVAALATGVVGGSQAVLDFVARLTAEGLMRPAADAAAASGEPQIATALIGRESPTLIFEIFEDMKSLILLDPVHETDEARGWPALPRDHEPVSTASQ
jgi:hypothetical protein